MKQQKICAYITLSTAASKAQIDYRILCILLAVHTKILMGGIYNKKEMI